MCDQGFDNFWLFCYCRLLYLIVNFLIASIKLPADSKNTHWNIPTLTPSLISQYLSVFCTFLKKQTGSEAFQKNT